MRDKTLSGQLPPNLPALSALLADFYNPSSRMLARAFDVSRSTAWRWINRDKAPRAVLAALYLAAPSYGGVDTLNKVFHAEEGMRLQAALAHSLKRECDALRRELARVVAMGDFGAANDPARFDVGLLRPVGPQKRLGMLASIEAGHAAVTMALPTQTAMLSSS
jgi:hypothetical protein